MDRCAVFIDGAYVDKLTQHHLDGVRIDFEKLTAHVSAGRSLLRSYYYHCLPYQSSTPTCAERNRFASAEKYFAALCRLSRFEVRLGKLEYRGKRADGSGIFAQKRVDILLGVDMVDLAATHQISTAVLIAGDSDFLPAVETVKRHGVLTVLWHGSLGGPGRQSTCHNDLWDACDERFELSRDVARAVARD